MKITKMLTSLLAALAVFGCSKTEESPVVYGDKIEVRIGMNGDISVSTDSETRSSADNGIYGINVYFDKDKDSKTDDIYAYGVFDNVADMTITLLSGYKYKFVCTFAKNGEHSLYYGQYDGNSYMGYAKPFATNKHSSTELGNKFIYSNQTSEYLSGIGNGDAVVCDLTTGAAYTQTYPRIHRYYGELDSYSPVAGGVATIPLKKTVFGMKLIIKGVPEGSLNADVKANGTSLLNMTATQADYVSGNDLYSYVNVYDCWKNESTIPGTVTWSYTSDKFSQWNLSGSSEITFKRNVLTTITVSVTPDSASASISLTEEEWDDENTINMGINTDGLIDIIVNPEPED